jgi:hypothetical protein
MIHKIRPEPVKEEFPIDQPQGENFFLANVIIDDPSDPCWDDGFIVGSWHIVTRAVSMFLACDLRARQSKVRIYQGDKARERLIEGLAEEARYQQQKRAQPNN